MVAHKPILKTMTKFTSTMTTVKIKVVLVVHYAVYCISL